MKSRFILFLFILLNSVIYSQDMIRVNVSSDPSGASFTFKGSNNVMTTPFSMKFSKSLNYTITFTKPGYEPKTVSYRGGSGDIFVKLEREKIHQQKPGADMVRVNVNSDPSGASFTFEGSNNVMTTPFSMKFSKSLTYSITFSKHGYKSKTISYRGGSGDIFIMLELKQQNKPKDDRKSDKKKPNDVKTSDVIVKIKSNPPGAVFVIAGIHDVMITPTSMKFKKNQTYTISFTMPGFLPKTIVYHGGSGDININLQKMPNNKKTRF